MIMRRDEGDFMKATDFVPGLHKDPPDPNSIKEGHTNKSQ